MLINFSLNDVSIVLTYDVVILAHMTYEWLSFPLVSVAGAGLGGHQGGKAARHG
jgi:hypothetical protein